MRAVVGIAASLLLAAAAAAPPPAAPAPPRVRQVDRLSDAQRFPRDMHPRTRARHARVMSAWRAPLIAAGSPLITPVDYGADPTGVADSTAAFAAAVAAMVARNTSGHHMADCVVDLGGVVLDLQGGDYLLSAPLAIPQCVGNLRIVDGSLRASPTFPRDRFVVEVGGPTCNTGQGSCNQNVGMSGLTVDGSHVAAGCVNIMTTMGATLDSSSAIFGFNSTGIKVAGGHETMISDTWVAAYFWNQPEKEKNGATGILLAGNDHYISNVIVYSARVGIELTGAANIVDGAHTWNCATGNGGVGILNRESQNRFTGCYLDFNDLVLENAQQVTVSDGFFLGGGQLVFAAPAAGSAIVATTVSGNVWYDTNGAALAVDETAGTWTSAQDLLVTGSTQPGAPRGVTVATKVLTVPLASWPADGAFTVDFSDVSVPAGRRAAHGCMLPLVRAPLDRPRRRTPHPPAHRPLALALPPPPTRSLQVLLFPHAPIQSATARFAGGPLANAAAAPYPLVGALPAKAGAPLTVTVYAAAPAATTGSLQLVVTADQSSSSSVFAVA